MRQRPRNPAPPKGAQALLRRSKPMKPEQETQPTEKQPAARGWWPRTRDSFNRRMRTSLRFGVELMREHEFWVHALAVKGGASAIVIAGVVALSYVIAAPFMLAAMGIAACGALVGLGIYGMAAGSARGWMRLRKIYADVTGTPMPEKHDENKPGWLQRQCARPAAQRVIQSRPVQALRNSRAWKLTQKYTDGQQDNVLGGIAVGGAAVTLVLGAVALATQLLVLPVIALGGLVTVAAVTAVTYLVSGISGLYFGITGIRHMKKNKRAKIAARAAADDRTQSIPTPMPAAADDDTKKKATADFAKVTDPLGLTPGNDNDTQTAPGAAANPASPAKAPRQPKG